MNISVGGYLGSSSAEDKRRGISACENIKAPLLWLARWNEKGRTLVLPNDFERRREGSRERDLRSVYYHHRRDWKLLRQQGHLISWFLPPSMINLILNNCTFFMLASSRQSVGNPSAYDWGQFAKRNTSPPCFLMSSDTLSNVPFDLARRMTLYSFANRRDNDDPKPGPTPAMTASPWSQTYPKGCRTFGCCHLLVERYLAILDCIWTAQSLRWIPRTAIGTRFNRGSPINIQTFNS